jgi:hypothetical protein
LFDDDNDEGRGEQKLRKNKTTRLRINKHSHTLVAAKSNFYHHSMNGNGWFVRVTHPARRTDRDREAVTPFSVHSSNGWNEIYSRNYTLHSGKSVDNGARRG